MPKTYTCRDAGVPCDWKVRGETEDEIMRKIRDHARTTHKMNEIPKAQVIVNTHFLSQTSRQVLPILRRHLITNKSQVLLLGLNLSPQIQRVKVLIIKFKSTTILILVLPI